MEFVADKGEKNNQYKFDVSTNFVYNILTRRHSIPLSSTTTTTNT